MKLFDENEADLNTFVTVFIPTFKTGEKISRCFLPLLKEQTYSNWEWIIVDDSDDKKKIGCFEERLKKITASIFLSQGSIGWRAVEKMGL